MSTLIRRRSGSTRTDDDVLANRASCNETPEANAPGVMDSAGGRESDGAKAHQLARQVIAQCEAVFALTRALVVGERELTLDGGPTPHPEYTDITD
jgi:hypothetical protein